MLINKCSIQAIPNKSWQEKGGSDSMSSSNCDRHKSNFIRLAYPSIHSENMSFKQQNTTQCRQTWPTPEFKQTWMTLAPLARMGSKRESFPSLTTVLALRNKHTNNYKVVIYSIPKPANDARLNTNALTDKWYLYYGKGHHNRHTSKHCKWTEVTQAQLWIILNGVTPNTSECLRQVVHREIAVRKVTRS